MNDPLTTTTIDGSVECLGQTFPSETARRENLLKLLAEKLKEPALRKTEGFPQGTDEAILAMSDPPYNTAVPNPFLADFVGHFGKPFDPSVTYSREPQTIDVSVGKTDPLDNLLKAFEFYKSFTGHKIKDSRLEVLRAGFRAAWANKDYQTILGVAKKLTEETLQNDEKLLLWYDQALTRMEAGS
jgi:hypothetical protein